MLFDEDFSKAGKASAAPLAALRAQAGLPRDPPQARPAWRSAADSEEPSKQEGEPRTGWEPVYRGLVEMSGDDSHDGVSSEVFRPPETLRPSGPQEARRAREARRPSSAFLRRGRGDMDRLDPTLGFRAPPVGTYTPNDEVGRPRMRSTVPFGKKRPHSASGAIGGRDRQDTGAELGDALEKKAPHIGVMDFSKVPPRGDFFKASGVQYHENSSTARLVDGDLRCSQRTRQPCHEFSKTTRPDRMRESLAEPGLYNVKDRVVRPTSGQQNHRFDRQTGRRPISAPVHSGHCRPSVTRSCPQLSTERRVCGVPDLAKTTARPGSAAPAGARQHRQTAAAHEEEVLAESAALQDDLERREKQQRQRPKSAIDLGRSINRQQHQRAQRNYGDDVCLQLMRENARGPVSVELMDDVKKRDCFEPHVYNFKFSQMPGRERLRKYTEPPARRRVVNGRPTAKFGRCGRTGETRCKVKELSQLAADISELRATRSYAAMTADEQAAGGGLADGGHAASAAVIRRSTPADCGGVLAGGVTLQIPTHLAA